MPDEKAVAQMAAGRELDALVAAKVMGLECWRNMQGDCRGPYCSVHDAGHYSTSIADAWLVVEKLRQTYGVVKLSYIDPTWLFMGSRRWGQREPDFAGEADEAPLAICRAALLACGSEGTP